MGTDFTLDDFANQLHQLRRLPTGTDPLNDLLESFRDSREQTLARIDRILAAVSPEERRDPGRIGPAERSRIAAESGTAPADVERFFAGFERIRSRLAEVGQMGMLQRLRLVLGTPGCAIYLLPWLLAIGLLAARVFGW
jgi:signal recognition particle GTPase